MCKVKSLQLLSSIEGLYTHNKYPGMVQTTDVVTIPQINIEVNELVQRKVQKTLIWYIKHAVLY